MSASTRVVTGRFVDRDLPQGFEQVHIDNRVSLVLPTAVVPWYRDDLGRRKMAESEARCAAEHEQRREQPAALVAAPAPPQLPTFSAEAAHGWHRVLPGLQAMLDEPWDADMSIRAADKEIRQRHVDVRKTLAKLGPDRRIARPAEWRASMAELEIDMPNFKEPIHVLRNALALGEASMRPVRVPPMLLLGLPGVGKTLFSQRVAKLTGSSHAVIAFDQPSAGAQLRGSEKYWSNTESGLLFNTICLGEFANPVILLDEIDKSCSGSGVREADPLAQLLSALEPQTSRRTVDASTDVEFDASLATYIATSNSLRGLSLPLLSRFEVFVIEPPNPSDSLGIARSLVSQVLSNLQLAHPLRVDPKSYYVLAHLSPRLMLRTAQKAVAAAVAGGQTEVSVSDLWEALGPEPGPRLH